MLLVTVSQTKSRAPPIADSVVIYMDQNLSTFSDAVSDCVTDKIKGASDCRLSCYIRGSESQYFL